MAFDRPPGDRIPLPCGDLPVTLRIPGGSRAAVLVPREPGAGATRALEWRLSAANLAVVRFDVAFPGQPPPDVARTTERIVAAACWARERTDGAVPIGLLAEGRTAPAGLLAARDSEVDAVVARTASSGHLSRLLSLVDHTPAIVLEDGAADASVADWLAHHLLTGTLEPAVALRRWASELGSGGGRVGRVAVAAALTAAGVLGI